MNTQKTILIITDGIGCKPDSICNAFADANKPTFDFLLNNVPKTLISTHGLSVGLPVGQMGNSEVGHMTIGSGRILYQDLVKVTLASQDGSLQENQALKNLIEKCNTIHIIGLVSDGGVHSHVDHIVALAKIASTKSKKVKFHIITDGRDVSPTSAGVFVQQLVDICNENIMIATMGGRFYGMDRDNRWERIHRAYKCIVDGDPKTTLSPIEYVNVNYKKEIHDEFIEPVAFENYNGANENDGFIFANFRSDRARELTTALGVPVFNSFERTKLFKNFITLTRYDNTFDFDVMFDKSSPQNTLAQIVAQNNLTQLHAAETEKYAHVTFFFNGGIEDPYIGESRVLIPSPDVKTYDMLPQMSANEVGDAVLNGMEQGYDFVVVNFANGDMVGHTGNYEAAKIAVGTVDTQVGKILKKAKELDYAVVITSDHGNCEEMKDKDGHILTNHTVGEVWCYVIAPNVNRLKSNMGLSNIAPTILEIMGLEIPSQMDESLIDG